MGQIGPIILIIPGMGGKLPMDQAAAIQSLIWSNAFLVGVTLPPSLGVIQGSDLFLDATLFCVHSLKVGM